MHIYANTMTRSFGSALREDFLFGGEWRNLNHGSFGTYPRPVRDAMRKYQDECESRVDTFMRFTFEKYLDQSREAVAKVVNAPVESLAYVLNATTGMNTVLRDLVFQPGEHIVYMATTYGAVENTITYITEKTPAKATKVEYTYPMSDDQLVDALSSTIKNIRNAGEEVKVAVFDTVVSAPGVRMPFERLTKTCRELGVLSAIDGAHGIGQVELDLTKLDPDFFVSNCHKWLYVPRGCAIFYVPVRNQHLIRSTVPTSHGFIPKHDVEAFAPISALGTNKSRWQNNFDFVGTADISPYFTVPDAIAFRESLGGEAEIRKYCFKLARDAGKHVSTELGTKILENPEGTLGECCFSNVQLPLDMDALQELARKAEKQRPGSFPGEITAASVGARLRYWMPNTMCEEYATHIQTYYYNGSMWVRLSAQAYLDLDDFKWGANVLKELCGRVMKGEAFATPQKPTVLS